MCVLSFQEWKLRVNKGIVWVKANIFSKEDYICHIQIRFEGKRIRNCYEIKDELHNVEESS